jgi:hypothetical protein
VGSTPTRAICPLFGWCSSRRSVKPLPSICEAVGERFDSFITHLAFGPVVYWLRTPPSHGGKAGSIPAGATLYVFSRLSTFPGAAGVQPALIKPACPARYRGLGHAGGPVLGRVSYARTPRFDSRARNRWHGTRIGIAIGSRARCLWVRLPPVSHADASLTSRGPMATTPLLQRGNGGSTPSGTTG